MNQYFPVVIEREDNGSYSAWVAGLPGVYAAADTPADAKRGIRSALAAHLATLKSLGRTPQPRAEVVVLRQSARIAGRGETLRFAGLGALLGRKTSIAKVTAARRNGRKGGRPRKGAAAVKAR